MSDITLLTLHALFYIIVTISLWGVACMSSLLDRWGNGSSGSWSRWPAVELGFKLWSRFRAHVLEPALWPFRVYEVPSWSLHDSTPGCGGQDRAGGHGSVSSLSKSVWLEQPGNGWGGCEGHKARGSHILEETQVQHYLQMGPSIQARRLNHQDLALNVFYECRSLTPFKTIPEKRESKGPGFYSPAEPLVLSSSSLPHPHAASYLFSLPCLSLFCPRLLSFPSLVPLRCILSPFSSSIDKVLSSFSPASGCLGIVLICSSELCFSISSQT